MKCEIYPNFTIFWTFAYHLYQEILATELNIEI